LIAAVLAPGAARAKDVEIPFEKYELPNGLTVILSEDRRLPQVTVNVWYHVGAANQAPGKSGFAHLFEHMMFSGSKHVQPTPAQVLESIGTVFGPMANGSTDFDRTNYFETVHASELATALWLESDRMAFLLDTLDVKKLAIQRDVVSNERRQNYENRPYGTGYLRICDLLYPSPHPYFECVIGSIPDIQAASIEDLRSFFREFYAPNNASLVIAGHFDPAEARALVEQYFGPILRGPQVVRPEVRAPKLSRVVTASVVDKVAEVPRLDVVFEGLRPFDEEEPAGEVLLAVLGGGKASRLYRSLVFEKRVASEVNASNWPAGLGGVIAIEATAKAGIELGALLPVIDAEIARLKAEGPTEAEVDRAKRKIIAQKVRAVERVGGGDGRAELLNQYQTMLGDPGFLPKDLARYRAVTREAAQAFAVRHLPSDARIELSILPATRTGTAAARRRSTP
jgi:predicted Zn-dependent peptidase